MKRYDPVDYNTYCQTWGREAMSDSIISDLADLLRRAQGRIDQETGRDIDIGDLVVDLRKGFEKQRAEIEALETKVSNLKECLFIEREAIANRIKRISCAVGELNAAMGDTKYKETGL